MLLQRWERSEAGGFTRSHAGERSAYSGRLGAWLVPVDGGLMLRLADDPAGERLWPTAEEAERANAAAERAAAEAARARVAELEAELARRRGDTTQS